MWIGRNPVGSSPASTYQQRAHLGTQSIISAYRLTALLHVNQPEYRETQVCPSPLTFRLAFGEYTLESDIWGDFSAFFASRLARRKVSLSATTVLGRGQKPTKRGHGPGEVRLRNICWQFSSQCSEGSSRDSGFASPRAGTRLRGKCFVKARLASGVCRPARRSQPDVLGAPLTNEVSHHGSNASSHSINRGPLARRRNE
ncbi:unnamed protein product [Diplocarpon coronariae]|nr:hypothetical protein JHW43_004772 [Diplocarpon mali]